jgi:hypothetical protein
MNPVVCRNQPGLEHHRLAGDAAISVRQMGSHTIGRMTERSRAVQGDAHPEGFDGSMVPSGWKGELLLNACYLHHRYILYNYFFLLSTRLKRRFFDFLEKCSKENVARGNLWDCLCSRFILGS